VQGRRKTTTFGTRYVAAFGFSLSCHATLLLALTLVPVSRVRIASERPLVIAIVDAAGDGTADAGSSAGGGAARV